MVLDVLAREKGLEVAASARGRGLVGAAKAAYPAVAWRELNAETASVSEIGEVIAGANYVVSCIGLIKHRFDEADPAGVERAIAVNALFPQRLGRAAQASGARVLQIATDCVYSGARGAYVETDPHDALDVYGKTKSLGECRGRAVSSLRCSIVGAELEGGPSLLEWFLAQPRGARLNGFTNHRWNGVTTLHFGKICAGIIKNSLETGPLRHIVPGDSATKHELLSLFARVYGRGDVAIAPVPAPTAVDRTLATADPRANAELWKAAGYDAPPSIALMVSELAAYKILLAKAVKS